jgi:ceramide glucosyltransferase
MFVHLLGWFVSGFALVGVGYTAIVTWLVLRFGGNAERGAYGTEAVSILKPLHFEDPALEEAIASFLDQDYQGPVQIVFGVQDAADPAIAIVRNLRRRFPSADIELVVDTDLHCANRKVSNLINMSHYACHDIIVVSDSDIAVPHDWLRRITGALAKEGVGAVSCLYAGKAEANGWSVMSAMGASYGFLPNVIASLHFGLATPCFGSTIAMRRETFEAIGGFRAIANKLADDYEMGRAIRAHGKSVVFPAFAVEHFSVERSLKDFYLHEVRWNRTTRVIAPLGHAGSVITHPVPLALVALVLTGFAVTSGGILALALASRILLKVRVDGKFATRTGPIYALPLSDVLCFSIYLASFFAEEVHWRGSRFAVSTSGALSQP